MWRFAGFLCHTRENWISYKGFGLLGTQQKTSVWGLWNGEWHFFNQLMKKIVDSVAALFWNSGQVQPEPGLCLKHAFIFIFF